MQVVLITQYAGDAQRHKARFRQRAGIIRCIGDCGLEAEARFAEALARAPFAAVRPLRVAGELAWACWLMVAFARSDRCQRCHTHGLSLSRSVGENEFRLVSREHPEASGAPGAQPVNNDGRDVPR